MAEDNDNDINRAKSTVGVLESDFLRHGMSDETIASTVVQTVAYLDTTRMQDLLREEGELLHACDVQNGTRYVLVLAQPYVTKQNRF